MLNVLRLFIYIFSMTFLSLPLAAKKAVVVKSSSDDKMKKYMTTYENNRKSGKPNLLFDFVYKELKPNIPVCRADIIEQSISECDANNCLQPMEFAGLKMWQEVIVQKRSEDTCAVKLPDRIYSIKKFHWKNFAKSFEPILSAANYDEAFNILAEVGTTGAAKRKKVFSRDGLKCEYNIFYEFKVDKKNNVMATESYKMSRDGFEIKTVGNKTNKYYSENGVTYQAIDSKKPVFFYPQVKFIEPASEKLDKACEEASFFMLFPYVLERMDQVEFLPPDQL